VQRCTTRCFETWKFGALVCAAALRLFTGEHRNWLPEIRDRIGYFPTMRVVRVVDPGVDEPAVQLVDGNGQVVEDVSAFLRVLTVRRFSPNAVRAYAHDLQKLMLSWKKVG